MSDRPCSIRRRAVLSCRRNRRNAYAARKEVRHGFPGIRLRVATRWRRRSRRRCPEHRRDPDAAERLGRRPRPHMVRRAGDPPAAPAGSPADISAGSVSRLASGGVAARRAQRSAESVSAGRRLGPAAGGAKVGIDGERHDRAGRHDLGGRSLRQFRRRRHDVRRRQRGRRSDLPVRHVRARC